MTMTPPPATNRSARCPPREVAKGASRRIAYWRLARPGVVSMTLLSMAVAASIGGSPDWPRLLHALLGTAAVIVGAVAANQRLERAADAVMRRTADRPLPSRRLASAEVTRFAVVATLAGLAYLAVFSGWLITLLAAASWLLYVAVYTPLKYRTIWQTPVGALAGAMPVLIGAAAGGDLLAPRAWLLLGLLFLWQLPHSMAIAWLYREQFATAGVKLPTVTDPSGRLAATIGFGAALMLLAVTCQPTLLPHSPAYLGIGVAAWVLYLTPAARFLHRRTDRRARHLLRASLIYLSVVLVTLLLGG